MSTTPSYRAAILILLPVFTLLLGWQIGVHAQQKEVLDLEKQLATFYGADTQSGTIAGDPKREVDISLLWNTWRVLQSRYIESDKLKTQDMLYGAVDGLVRAVGDPYTVFMTPRQNTDFRDALSGHLQGIGAELGIEEDRIMVVAPLKGSPAERAGLRSRDVIIEVDGKDISGQSLDQVVSQVRGAKGTKVTLRLMREGEADLVTLTITRDDITVPSTEYSVEKTAAGDVGYLIINQFGSETIGEVRGILTGVDPAALKGFIIDLRYNGGGYLDGAVDLVSMFMKEGIVVTVAGREQSDVHRVSGVTILPVIPLVVLQNEGSASASEIAAGSLQDYKRATVIGMKSFGKGTVQEVVDLPGGSSLRVTIARWLTPNGKDLGKEGVTPDHIVNRTREDAEANRDPQLQAALEFLSTGKITVKTGTGSAQ